MNRSRIAVRQKEREKVKNRNTSNTIVLETFKKILVGKRLDRECLNDYKTKLKNYYNLTDYHFDVVENSEEFHSIIKLPSVVSYKNSNGRWVLMYLMKDNSDEEVNVLYRHFCGDEMTFSLRNLLEESFNKLKIIENELNKGLAVNATDSALLCVKNLDLLLMSMKTTPDKFVNNFTNIEFCSIELLNNDKLQILRLLVGEMAQNQSFKHAFKEFVESLPFESAECAREYRKVLEEEFEKDEDEVNIHRVEEAKNRLLNNKHVKKFQESIMNGITDEDAEITNYDVQIQKQFPDEMNKLQTVFEILDAVKVDDSFIKLIQMICEFLEIDSSKMINLYKLQIKSDTSEETTLRIDDIEDVIKRLPKMEQPAPKDYKPLEELLAEIKSEMNCSQQQALTAIEILQTQYNLVKDKYKNWESSGIKGIYEWACGVKGRLSCSCESICEAIAALDRAFNLLNGGYRLRDTQILAVLTFFQSSETGGGKLCQIKTGEGKTVIVALLAIVKVLQGEIVDVITSNPLLAADGVAENRDYYNVFNISVATNNYQEEMDNKLYEQRYEADVLYGTISNFQFDYLKDSFEGFTIRKNRVFGQVILDEVDSMLIDNGGHIAKLATPYPGMECLKYIYIKIWQELHKAEQRFVQIVREEIQSISREPENVANQKFDELVQNYVTDERKIIKDMIRKSKVLENPLMPDHLKDYADKKLDVWLKNALHAKYNCHEFQQYRIVRNDSGEEIVAPVDYLNTGVTLRNTIWSNGLHQFVQLKHNIRLTYESLTSSFISNIGYIRKYPNKNIFGLTGTLGSEAEQKLLSSIYNVTYAKLPTYKKKKFQELPGLILEDALWNLKIVEEVLKKIDERRAVLMICETEQDVMAIRESLETVAQNFRLRIYTNEDYAAETQERVRIGDIILATNIAGRGTNFKTERELEENGGLHVCVGFLPCNLRVEEQAFGRTSRQGNDGTAQLVIRESEVAELGIGAKNPDFAEIKNERDFLEKERLKSIENLLVKELDFKDELFKYFSDFYRLLKKGNDTREYWFVLEDLKECWAFWLEKNNFTAETIRDKTPQQEFDHFKQAADAIIKGSIQHNPFYCVLLSEFYLSIDNRAKAEQMAFKALTIGNGGLMTGAHLKLFEIAILNGEEVRQRFKEAVGKFFALEIYKDDRYKAKALHHLQNAKIAVENEIDYMKENFSLSDDNKSTDFRSILTSDSNENIFFKHLNSRQNCLTFHRENIINLIEKIKESYDIDLGGKCYTTMKSFVEILKEKKVEDYVTSFELSELHSVGVDAFYALEDILEIPTAIIITARSSIVAGIVVLVVGLAFPPFLQSCSSLAATLISDGIIDIVMELIIKRTEEFDRKAFIKAKFISYGITLITLGIGAMVQSVKILNKAIAFCRKLSSFLRNSKYLKTLCERLANLIDKIQKILEKLLLAAEINKLKEMEKIGQVSRTTLTTQFAKSVTLDIAKSLTKSILVIKVLDPLFELAFGKILEQICSLFIENFKTRVNNCVKLTKKLQTASKKSIDEVLDDFLNKTNDFKDTAEEIGFGFMQEINKTSINLLISVYKLGNATVQASVLAKEAVGYLERNLEEGNANNDTSDIVNEICLKLAENLKMHLKNIVKIVISSAFDFKKLRKDLVKSKNDK